MLQRFSGLEASLRVSQGDGDCGETQETGRVATWRWKRRRGEAVAARLEQGIRVTGLVQVLLEPESGASWG